MMMKALSHTELSAALTGETSGGALAQIKQSNPPVASSRLVAVSAVTALFVGNGAMRWRGGLETAFSSPILRMPDACMTHVEKVTSRIGVAFPSKLLWSDFALAL